MGVKTRLRKLESEVHANNKEFVVGFKYPMINEMEIPMLNFKDTIEDGDKLLSGRKSYMVYIENLED